MLQISTFAQEEMHHTQKRSMMNIANSTHTRKSHITIRPWRKLIASAMTLFAMLFSFPTASRGQINTDRMMMIARNALAYDDYVLSISYFNIVINYKPYLYEPYFFRGVAKFYLDDYSGTVNDCTKAININPYYPNSYELRGLAYINLERFSEASSDYKKATEFNPEERSMWHNLALCYINMDSLNLADSVAETMIHKWAKYADGYCLKSQIMLEKKDTLKALEVAGKAVEADKFNANALTLRANLLMWHEDYKEAIDSYTEAIRIDPKQAGNLINRALCYYHIDKYREAMTDYDKALDMEPNNFVGHYNRGLLRANVGEDNLAIEDFNFILEADPSDMMATFNRATLLDNTGDYRGAIRDYTTVIKEYPKFLLGYEKRAEARRKIGDIAGARRDEEHVLKEQIAKRYGYSTPTSRMKNKTRKKSEFNIEDYNKMVEEDEQEQTTEYASEYRGKVQNKQNDGKLMLPNQRTYTIYKEAGKEEVLNTFEKAFRDAQAGNINEAIAGFDKVIETSPSIAEAYYDRGLLKLLLDDNMGAIPDLSKAGELGIYQAYSIIKKNQKLKKSSSK